MLWIQLLVCALKMKSFHLWVVCIGVVDGEEETGDTDLKMPSASTELQQDQIPHQPEFPDASTCLKPRLLLSVTKKGGCDDVND